METGEPIAEENCRKCGTVLFKKGINEDKGNMIVIRRRHRPPESDGKNYFYRCQVCWAKNRTIIEISADGVAQDIITGVIE
jgi:hypothetical protein